MVWRSRRKLGGNFFCENDPRRKSRLRDKRYREIKYPGAASCLSKFCSVLNTRLVQAKSTKTKDNLDKVTCSWSRPRIRWRRRHIMSVQAKALTGGLNN